jgi:flagellar biosynthetic protein FliQ
MTDLFLTLLREALFLVLACAAPPVLAVLAVGVLAGFVQTATQVRDAAISTVPKILAALVALALAGPWIGGRVASFSRTVFETLPKLAGK